MPGKNVRPLAGRPLLDYTAEAALAATSLARAVLSTDDEAIAQAGLAAGLEVPFLRPAVLARDDTPSLPVVQHALERLEAFGETYDAVCLLQPTTPFRRPGLIDDCVAALERHGCDSVVTVTALPPEHHPLWVYGRGSDGLLRLTSGDGAEPVTRRQDLPPAYVRDGSIYVTRVEAIKAGSLYGGRCFGFVVNEATINIDTPEDWARAESAAEAHR